MKRDHTLEVYASYIEEVDGGDGSHFLACVACADLTGGDIVFYRWSLACLNMGKGVAAALAHLAAEHPEIGPVPRLRVVGGRRHAA